MAAKYPSNAAAQAERRQNSAERRAAQLAALATQQSDLKAEAAERMARRERDAKSKAKGSGSRPGAAR